MRRNPSIIIWDLLRVCKRYRACAFRRRISYYELGDYMDLYFMSLFIGLGLAITIIYVIVVKLIGEYMREEKWFKKRLAKAKAKKRPKMIQGWKAYRRSQRRPWYGILLMTIVLGVPLFLGLWMSGPLLLDLPRVLTGNLNTLTGVVHEVGRAEYHTRSVGYSYYIRIDGKYYNSNVKVDASLMGKEIKVRYLKHANVVLKIEEIP